MFVSYAQNFEDVILWRALQHVERGFYIDIGAWDPVIDSVSLGFYDKGWRGVHVEPVAQYAQKLRAARPDEQVIEAAIGRSQETIRLFEIADTGLSTASEAIAQSHMARGLLDALRRRGLHAVVATPGCARRRIYPLAQDRCRGHGAGCHRELAAIAGSPVDRRRGKHEAFVPGSKLRGLGAEIARARL